MASHPSLPQIIAACWSVSNMRSAAVQKESKALKVLLVTDFGILSRAKVMKNDKAAELALMNEDREALRVDLHKLDLMTANLEAKKAAEEASKKGGLKAAARARASERLGAGGDGSPDGPRRK